MLRLARAGFFLLLPWAASQAASPAPKAADPVIEQGEIDGAHFIIARPLHWNHRLLLLAHGYLPATAPLVAELSPDRLAYRTLLAEGWMIATTSFRRNGVIVADAIADLDALRARIVAADGKPERVILEGESMGGLIVTLMAEREPTAMESASRSYDGAVAIGAALDLREDNMTVGLTLQPRIPLIFLTNQTELGGPAHYVAPKTLPDNIGVRPVLFRVARNGHMNVSQHERLATLRALNRWLDGGRETLPPPREGELFYDATLPVDSVPSQVVPHADGRGFDARVLEIAGGYGNVRINAQPEDFAAAGIRPFMWLQLRAGSQTQRVRYGRDFDSVRRGEWVVFPSAEGFCWLARSYDNAAESAGLRLGDTVTLQQFDEAQAP